MRYDTPQIVLLAYGLFVHKEALQVRLLMWMPLLLSGDVNYIVIIDEN